MLSETATLGASSASPPDPPRPTALPVSVIVRVARAFVTSLAGGTLRLGQRRRLRSAGSERDREGQLGHGARVPRADAGDGERRHRCG